MSPASLQPFQGSYLTPAFEHATVADAMRTGVISCPAEASLTTVARMLAMNHVHCVAVDTLDPQTGSDRVWGIVSDLDIVRAANAPAAEPTAGELAQGPPATIDVGARIADAARLMAEHGLHHLVVVSGAPPRPVGIVSSLDIAGILAWGRG